MKSRSHWLPALEPHHDDWVDGSWTVDCICGVNFDDGEEMVNCDECGVWVHTRCSRYVKSEKSFACDKCKTKNNFLAGGGAGTSVTRNNDPEETEVAEFLVELPTKTLRMDNPNPNPPSISSRAPARLWAPMEERVHVQGVPGGDLHLFSGISSLFGPQLWKSTGYVPKKFDSPYIELPCSGDRMDLEKNQAGDGAGCLFPLSKENGNNLPLLVYSVGARTPAVPGILQEVQHKKMLSDKSLSSERAEDSVKKEIRSKQPIILYSTKHKKEKIGMSKDLKKKVRSIEQDKDTESRTANVSGAGIWCGPLINCIIVLLQFADTVFFCVLFG